MNREWIIQRAPWVLIAAGLLVFGHGALNQFVLFDDDLHIFRNPILGANGWEALKYFWSQPHKGLYIPVTYTLWLAQATILKMIHPGIATDAFSPIIFHVTNVLLHILNACLFYRVLKIWVKRAEIQLLGAFLFLLHPVQVEAVAWATGMKDLVAMSFALASTLAYFRAQRTQGEKKWVWASLAGVAYLFSVLAKPASLVLPLVVGGLEFLFLAGSPRRILLRLVPALVLVSPLAFLTSELQPLERNMYLVPLWGRPLVVADAFFFYLGKLLFPFPLVHDYGRLPALVIYGWSGPVLLGVLVIGSVALAYFRRWRILFFGALFLVALGPVSGLVQFAFQNFSTVADHYLYFPILVPLVGLCVWLDRPWPQSRERIVAGSLVVLAGLATYQVGVWRDSDSLFAHTLAFNPRSILAHNNLAVQFEERGDYRQSLDHYRISLAIAPQFAHHHYNVGNLLMKLDALTEAEKEFHETLKLDPAHPDALFNLGILAEAARQSAEARSYFSRVLQADPLSVKARVKLGDLEKAAGNFRSAERFFRDALEIDPLSPQANLRMADFLQQTGHPIEASPFYARVLQLKPQHERRAEILSYLR